MSDCEFEMMDCDLCERSLPEDQVIYCSCCVSYTCNDCNAESLNEGGVDCGDREPYACPTCFAEMENEKEEESDEEEEEEEECVIDSRKRLRINGSIGTTPCDIHCMSHLDWDEAWECQCCTCEGIFWKYEICEKEEEEKPLYTCRECGAKNTIDDILVVGFGVPKEYECCKCWSPKEWKRLEEEYYKQ